LVGVPRCGAPSLTKQISVERGLPSAKQNELSKKQNELSKKQNELSKKQNELSKKQNKLSKKDEYIIFDNINTAIQQINKTHRAV